MAKEKEEVAENTMSPAEKKGIISKAYPEGKVVKMNKRIKVKCIKDTPGGMIKGNEYEMHPTTASQLEQQGIVKSLD